MTLDQDICKAMELWRRGAHYRRLAALVALPRHYMRGDFAECGVEISPDQLMAYLQDAKELTRAYYQTMLIEDLMVEVDRSNDH